MFRFLSIIALILVLVFVWAPICLAMMNSSTGFVNLAGLLMLISGAAITVVHVVNNIVRLADSAIFKE